MLITGLIILKHSVWKYLQWNPRASFTLFQYVYHLYLLLFKVMVAVFRYLVSETKYFFVTHSGISFVQFLDGLPLEQFSLDLKYLCIWPLFPHLLQIIFVISYDSHTEPLNFQWFGYRIQFSSNNCWMNAQIITMYALRIKLWL